MKVLLSLPFIFQEEYWVRTQSCLERLWTRPGLLLPRASQSPRPPLTTLSPISQCVPICLFVFPEEMKGGREVSEKDEVERRERKNQGRRKRVHGEGWGNQGPIGIRMEATRKGSFAGLQPALELQLGDLRELIVGSLVLSRPQV